VESDALACRKIVHEQVILPAGNTNFDGCRSVLRPIGKQINKGFGILLMSPFILVEPINEEAKAMVRV
jgi:hypothetical protein